jgi:hypothetical protein
MRLPQPHEACEISHEEIPQFFERFEGNRYVPNALLRRLFPYD